MNSPLVYEIPARPWLYSLPKQPAGGPTTLADVPDSILADWASLGMTHVWLMGVWCRGHAGTAHAHRWVFNGQPPESVPHDILPHEVLGSPYAIAGHEVDPWLGGAKGLAVFRRNLHRHGMKLLLDFIPNHVALDHPWIASHAHRFVQSPEPREGSFIAGRGGVHRRIAHGKDPWFPPWTDTAQLDWRLRDVHEAMSGELSAVAGLCDGVRVDMAMLILRSVFDRNWAEWAPAGETTGEEFWPAAIRAVRRLHPDFLMMAEAYWDLEPELLRAGFDYAYDKRFYDHLVARRHRDLRAHWCRIPDVLRSGGVRFLENHDEARVASLCGDAEHQAWALMMLALPGMRLLHLGQLEGTKHRADIRCLRARSEPSRPAVSEGYRRLLGTLKSLAPAHGSATLLPVRRLRGEDEEWEEVAEVFACGWDLPGGRWVIAVSNLAPQTVHCSIPLDVTSAEQLPESTPLAWRFEDRLGKERGINGVGESCRNSLSLELSPHAVHLFEGCPAAC